MTDPNGPRPKFDTLFADPRHYRGDCRLLRTAVRRGWLNDAPQADRDALVARFEQAARERDAAGFVSDGQQARALLGWARVGIEMVGTDQLQALRALRYCCAGERDGRTTGRPRERWHVSDYPHRIDANELRRRALADGTDLRTLDAIHLRWPDAPEDAGERVALAVAPDARYGVRVWLVCPRCKRRRVYLYLVRAGVRCRNCACIGY